MTRRGPDNGLRKILRQWLPKPDFQWSSIETGATRAGLPDSHGLHRPTGRCFWVESKATDGWALKFEPHQISWHEMHAPHAATFVAVRATGLGSAEGAGDSLWIFSGLDVPLLVAGGLRGGATPLHKSLGPPRKWNWTEVTRVLTTV